MRDEGVERVDHAWLSGAKPVYISAELRWATQITIVQRLELTHNPTPPHRPFQLILTTSPSLAC